MLQQLSYNGDDLANTRFAISPLGHLIQGVDNSSLSTRSVTGERWWRQARRRVPDAAKPVIELVNARTGALPEFLLLVPPTAEPSFADELELLLATPMEQIRAALASEAWHGTAAAATLVRELQDGSSQALRRVADGVMLLFSACLADDWPDMKQHLRADLAYRARVMMNRGTGAMLQTLHPALCWHHDRLWHTSGSQLAGGTRGRGFVLMPCAFWRDGIHATIGSYQAPSLIYPARVNPAIAFDGPARDRLPDLIGAGRARALRAIKGGCSTTALAQRLSVSAPTASAHAHLLRAAGLISTERDGPRVQHRLTPLGADLLGANPARTPLPDAAP